MLAHACSFLPLLTTAYYCSPPLTTAYYCFPLITTAPCSHYYSLLVTDCYLLLVTLHVADIDGEEQDAGRLFEMVALVAEGETLAPAHTAAAKMDIDILAQEPSMLHHHRHDHGDHNHSHNHHHYHHHYHHYNRDHNQP